MKIDDIFIKNILRNKQKSDKFRQLYSVSDVTLYSIKVKDSAFGGFV